MRLGVIADSHDRVPHIEKAVGIFNREKVDATLHCGDFVSPFSLLPFKKLEAPLYAVFGNNDGEKAGIASLFRENGWTLNDRPWTLELGDRRIVMLHEPDRLSAIVAQGGCDLVVFGHTHTRRLEKKDGAMILNPGEACGWVNGRGAS